MFSKHKNAKNGYHYSLDNCEFLVEKPNASQCLTGSKFTTIIKIKIEFNVNLINT